MDVAQFLQTVVTGQKGWFCLGYAKILEDEARTKASWKEEFFSWPDETHNVINRVRELTKDYDVYFSPYLFMEQRSKKEFAIVGRTIVADLDEANVLTLPIEPSILVETSPGRHQGYWLLRESLDADEHERLSKQLTYSIPRCDRTGWFLGKKVRVPETYNNKYIMGPQNVRVVRNTTLVYQTSQFENLDQLDEKTVQNIINEENTDWAQDALDKNSTTGPNEMLSRVRSAIPTVVSRYNLVQKDRSAALWALTMSLFRAGMSRDKVLYIAFFSPNNKFKDLKFGGLRELAKDVVRAEIAATTQIPDIKSAIKEARRLGENPYERSEYIAKRVREHLDKIGDFIHCNDDSAWFIRSDNGRPISISARSQHMLNMLDSLFGINASEKESSYVNHHLQSMVNDLPITGCIGKLSYYDHDLRTFILHTGRKDVLVVKPDGIRRENNGYMGVVFPWTVGTATISPQYQALDRPWEDELFEDCLGNIQNFNKDEAKAILKVWLLTVLLRDGLASRPILALFGAPGCISEDTVIQIKRGSHNRHYTIKEAYDKFHGNFNGRIGRPWNLSVPTRILSVKDDIISFRTIKDFIKSGRKKTFTVKIEGQVAIRVTKDHRFLTMNGYKKLEELSVGSPVIVQGDNILYASTGRTATWRQEVSAKYHPYARMKMVGKYGPYGNIYTYRAVYEAEMNGLTYEQFCWIINKNKEKAATLKYLSKNAVIYHKDENPYNNEYSNLEVVTKRNHDAKHGYNNHSNLGEYSGLYETKESTIESIEYYGEEETYDIEMEDQEAPNFLINGVVLHNSGKSTFFRRVYTLLYGQNKGLSSVTKEDNFDQDMSTYALVVLDNVDTYARWLPDRLAATVAPTEITRRKLFTDNDTVVIRRDAMLGITAHDPKFGRSDVTDRLLLLNFDRLSHFKPEAPIYDKIMRLRNGIWASILEDIKTVLGTPMPYSGYPQFRIEDYAQYGFWIASALGIAKEFTKGIESIQTHQKSFNLEEDQLLVESLERMLTQEMIEEMKVGMLWTRLKKHCRDERGFERRYTNAVTLGRKIFTLSDSLKEVFDIEWSVKYSVRVWTIRRLENGSGVANEKIQVGTS